MTQLGPKLEMWVFSWQRTTATSSFHGCRQLQMAGASSFRGRRKSFVLDHGGSGGSCSRPNCRWVCPLCVCSVSTTVAGVHQGMGRSSTGRTSLEGRSTRSTPSAARYGGACPLVSESLEEFQTRMVVTHRVSRRGGGGGLEVGKGRLLLCNDGPRRRCTGDFVNATDRKAELNAVGSRGQSDSVDIVDIVEEEEKEREEAGTLDGAEDNGSTEEGESRVVRRYDRVNTILRYLRLVRTGGDVKVALDELGGDLEAWELIAVIGRQSTYERVREVFSWVKQEWEAKHGTNLLVYHAVIKRAAKAKDWQTVESLVAAIERIREGNILDKATYSILTGIYAAVGKGEEANKWLERMLEANVDYKLSSYSYTMLIFMHLREGELGEAERLFEQMRLQGVRPTGITYNAMLRVHGAKKDGRRVLQVWDELLAADIKPNQVLYCSLIDALGKSGRMEAALQKWKELRGSGLKLDRVAYNMMINLHGKSGSLSEAEALFQEMWGVPGCEPDEVTYTTMFDLRAKAGKLEEAEAIIQEMDALDMPRTTVSFNALINMYGEAGKLREVRLVFTKMQRAGCLPTKATYNTLLKVFGKAGMVAEAERVWDRLGKSGFGREVGVYNFMIEMYGRAKMWEKAKTMFDDMKHEGLQPAPWTYDAIMKGLAAGGRFGDVLELYREMMALGYAKTATTFSTLIHVYTKSGLLPEAMEVWDEMMALGFQPDVKVWTMMIHVYGRAGMLKRAANIVKEMQRYDCQPTDVTYNTLIDVYGKAGKFDEAAAVLNEMLENAVRPDKVTFCTIINICGAAGQHDMARRMFQKMQNLGLLNLVGYNTMLHAYGRWLMIGEAEGVLKEMQAAGILPNLVTFTTMISMYSKAGMVEKAEAIFKTLTAPQGGVARMNRVIYCAMISMYAKAGQVDDALNLVERMRLDAIDLDEVAYNLIVSVYEMAGRPDLARTIKTEMGRVLGRPRRAPKQLNLTTRMGSTDKDLDRRWVNGR
ncbi:hypothetical protein CBR_g48205 [Chara braunii]|uniref:PROP1-like PPR domain-containing protein n=1 Tax=Chara braunii TaxID=69332 RepID=A0A388M2I3_CHABU|nr:hypothetical protein CBR_g48205 [Chara braunii]|eukprot:GBG88673.1 hypothetical protein CBR_g48205 [Chara braunii]